MSHRALRAHLIDLLEGGGAHLSIEEAVAEMPAELQGARVDGCPHTPWRLLEHMRICQWDILEFSRNPDHVSPPFPDGYWPEGDAPPNPEDWDRVAEQFQSDLREMVELVEDPSNDLYEKIPHGEGQTLLREALLVADHNAYHLGQLVILRRALGAWEDGP